MRIENAIAYIKRSEEESSPAITLSLADSPVLRDLGNGLLVAYLIDEGDSYCYVQHRDLEENHLSIEELHEIGIYNLAQILNEKLQVHETEGIYAVIMGGEFEASLLLVDALWDESLAHLTTSTFVVCLPCRDVLAFCDSESPAGIAKLYEIVSRLGTNVDHPASESLFIRTDGSWHKYSPNNAAALRRYCAGAP